MTHSITDLPRLERLHRWLTLERWAGTMGVAGFWLPVGVLTGAMTIAAVAFAPMMLHALWTLRRRGWVAGFAAVVGGTALATSLLAGLASVLAPVLTLLAFYIYCWVLKLFVSDWARVTTEAAEWRRTQARWAAERDTELADLLGEPIPVA